MAVTANNTGNVSVTRGVSGGYIFSAPAGTTLPTNFSTALGNSFVNLGFISEDGVTESISTDSEQMVDMNGDVICVASSSREENITLTLVEIKKDTLAEIYGQANVTDASGVITVKHKASDMPQRVYVLELLLKDGRKWRQVVPAGQVTEVGDLTLASGELAGREITIACNYDSTAGASVIDYIQSTETTA